MIEIVFESHGTTFDNEQKLSSGHFDVELSELGVEQSKQLGERRKNETFDAIFCSDLQRSYKTAEIAFGKKFPIIKDSRLRECDYGDLTRRPSEEVEGQRLQKIDTPFPNGESYNQCAQRMKSFLEDLRKSHGSKKVMVIGHRATQYGLERWIKGLSLEEIVSTPWSWQPGWVYQFDKFASAKIPRSIPFK